MAARAAGVFSPAAVECADPRDLMVAVTSMSQREIDALSAEEAEGFVLACDRLRSALDARRAVAMDTLAGRVDEDLQRRAQDKRRERVPVHPGPDLHGFVASMLAPGLHCSTRTVQRRLEADRRLVCTTESTHQALWDGNLDLPRADAVAEAARSVDPDLWPRFEALVLETTVDPVTGEITLVSEEVRRMSRSTFARRAARIARTLDPTNQCKAVEQARAQRRVVIRADRHQPGMAVWTAHLPAEVSQRMAAAVDALAGQYAKANPGTSIDSRRADALTALVLGNAEIKTVVELLIPIMPTRGGNAPARGALGQLNPVTATLTEPSGTTSNGATSTGATSTGGLCADGSTAGSGAISWVIPGQVDDPRHGALVPEVIAGLLADPDVIIRLARLDPDGSITQDPQAYRPSASTRRRVRARDGSCRFPGCHTPAARTDTDHVLAHPHGPTDHTNLISLCRTHHLFKHHSRWRPALCDDGTVVWTAPDGRTFTTHPRPHDLRDDLNPPEHSDPETGHQLRRGWYPGLPPGMSLADLATAEAQLPDDPPDPALRSEAVVTAVPGPPSDWTELDQHRSKTRQPESALERHLMDLLTA
ncbi:HNH endonuclease signature motif containing protein [Phycicoccus sp. SLBN-51]|uniref:HNH endonuclease signature motif containing protein n=1 Tax=Phycicoccus sp. SLBN-51 TaxID=2768447 RepID=UPI0011528D78|nr:HNH endonuclease signature motif containing protein [Phycicoccus sp. SLBN-51]